MPLLKPFLTTMKDFKAESTLQWFKKRRNLNCIFKKMPKTQFVNTLITPLYNHSKFTVYILTADTNLC